MSSRRRELFHFSGRSRDLSSTAAAVWQQLRLYQPRLAFTVGESLLGRAAQAGSFFSGGIGYPQYCPGLSIDARRVLGGTGYASVLRLEVLKFEPLAKAFQSHEVMAESALDEHSSLALGSES